MGTFKISLLATLSMMCGFFSLQGQTYHVGIPQFFPSANVADINALPYVTMSYGSYEQIMNNGGTTGYSGASTHSIITTYGQNDPNACYDGDSTASLKTMPDTLVTLPDWNEETAGPFRVMRLSDDYASSSTGASRITYHFIPTDESNVLVVYFAFVANNPTHSYSENPYFRIDVLNTSNNLLLSPATNSYFLVNPQGVSPAPNPEAQNATWFTCGTTGYSETKWTTWRAVSFNLRDYVGQQVKLRITTSDCSFLAHYGYSYFTAQGFRDRIKTTITTCSDSLVKLTVPNGFQSYTWYCNGVHIPDADERYEITRPRTITDTTYRCHLVSYTGAQMDFTTTMNYNEITSSFTANACMTYTWDNREYTASGNYSHTYTGSNGCDSIVTLHLTIYQPIRVDIYDTICQGDSYSYLDFDLPAQNWSGDTAIIHRSPITVCDSITTLHLTVNPAYFIRIVDTTGIGVTYNEFGFLIEDPSAGTQRDTLFLQTAAGCDSTVQLLLFIMTGIDEYENLANISLYPNPTGSLVTITADQPINRVDIYNVTGKLMIRREQVQDYRFEQDVTHFAPGVYILKIYTEQGVSGRKLIVIEN